MTVALQVEPGEQLGSLPSWINVEEQNHDNLEVVAKAIADARRIVVVCGAGVSVAAGIPDFRSSEGLFRSLKTDNPKELLTSGKDLFDASVFQTSQSTALFYKMIAELSSLSSSATPTTFHRFLKLLDEQGKLLRVYTQNIDHLEERAGLSYGVPHWRATKRSSPKKRASIPEPISPPSSPSSSESVSESIADPRPPRCVPLHGNLKSLVCQRCSHTIPLYSQLDNLKNGFSVPCPECESLNSVRRMAGKRDRGVGSMRPSVVLYGEAHRDGEGVGECVRRDLLGLGDVLGNSNVSNAVTIDGILQASPPKTTSPRAKASAKPDLLIVAGSSLKVPGTKRIVREFAKAVHANRPSGSASTSSTSHLSTPSPKKRRKLDRSLEERESSIKPPSTIYLNLDFPAPAREWQDVFDVWVQGDVQTVVEPFLDVLRQQESIPRGVAAKPRSSSTKRKGETRPYDMEMTPSKRRRVDAKEHSKRKAKAPPTPRSTPPKTKSKARVSRIASTPSDISFSGSGATIREPTPPDPGPQTIQSRHSPAARCAFTSPTSTAPSSPRAMSMPPTFRQMWPEVVINVPPPRGNSFVLRLSTPLEAATPPPTPPRLMIKIKRQKYNEVVRRLGLNTNSIQSRTLDCSSSVNDTQDIRDVDGTTLRQAQFGLR